MSLVRISEQLLGEVKQKVLDMRRSELAQYPGVGEMIEMTESHPDFDRYVGYAVSAAWGEHLHLRSVIPESWCTHPHAVDVYYKTHPLEARPQKGLYIRLRGTSNFMFPPKTSHFPDIYITQDIPELDALFNSPNIQMRETINERYNLIEAQVLAFLRHQKSLNAALKQHPELGMYVTPERINKVNEKVPRANSERGDEDEPRAVTLDIAALTAAAIAHRMTPGGAA